MDSGKRRHRGGRGKGDGFDRVDPIRVLRQHGRPCDVSGRQFASPAAGRVARLVGARIEDHRPMDPRTPRRGQQKRGSHAQQAGPHARGARVSDLGRRESDSDGDADTRRIDEIPQTSLDRVHLSQRRRITHRRHRARIHNARRSRTLSTEREVGGARRRRQICAAYDHS